MVSTANPNPLKPTFHDLSPLTLRSPSKQRSSPSATVRGLMLLNEVVSALNCGGKINAAPRECLPHPFMNVDDSIPHDSVCLPTRPLTKCEEECPLPRNQKDLLIWRMFHVSSSRSRYLDPRSVLAQEGFFPPPPYVSTPFRFIYQQM